MTALEKRVAVLEEDVRVLKEDVRILKADVSGLKEDVGGLQENVKDLQTDMKGMKVTLENETVKGIHIIAEGHLDLSRKLDLALMKKEKQEMMDLRILHLENEVQHIKEKMDIA